MKFLIFSAIIAVTISFIYGNSVGCIIVTDTHSHEECVEAPEAEEEE
jgi:hypothetical protein